ncbi:MAG: efflux RND transporter periplasmic adaptor subunit [Planctomycetota bacterium]|nr:MAG: efflux RND transporter periplasmic adaptor subunit [Planctomycetota bacterium]
MNTNQRSSKTAFRYAALVLAFMLTVSLLALVACRDKGVNHAAANDAEDRHSEGDGHDHGEGGHEHGGEVKLTPDAIARYGVKVEAASLYKLQPSFIAPARVAYNAESMAHVGTPLPGRVVDLAVRLGDRVKKGDALLIVESPELGEAQNDFLGKQIAAKAAESAVELAQGALDRAKGLYEETGGIALEEVKKREGELKAAQASLLTAQAAATASENKLHLLGMDQAAVEKLRSTGEVNPKFTIIAPLDGEVVEREVKFGELVNREKEALIVLADLSTLWVLADVPEARLPEIAIGADAWIHAGSLDPHRHEGQVSYIAPQIDPRTRTAAVRIVVKCEHGALRPGAFVQVEISKTDRNAEEPPPVVAVPEDAIQTVEGRSVVFVPVPKEENTFVERAVTVGKPVGGMVPVLSGLVEGEQFVAAGTFVMKAELGKSTAEHQH